jgi:hypothetical protein
MRQQRCHFQAPCPLGKIVSKTFSSHVATGSRQENATNASAIENSMARVATKWRKES